MERHRVMEPTAHRTPFLNMSPQEHSKRALERAEKVLCQLRAVGKLLP